MPFTAETSLPSHILKRIARSAAASSFPSGFLIRFARAAACLSALGLALLLGAGTAAAQAPTVSSVALVSTPTVDVDGDDTAETYKVGDVVRARVTFSAAVDVAGGPVLKLQFDPDHGEKSMTFDATPGRTNVRELFFDYTVVKGDLSEQGIAFYANKLSAGTEVTIRAAGTTVDANLNFDKVDHDAAHKVDGVAPTLKEALVDGDTLTQTYSEPLVATSKPAANAFRVFVGNVGYVSLADSDPVALSGSIVTLTLAEPIAAHKNVNTRYYKLESGAKLQDIAGNEVEDTPILLVVNNKTPPARAKVNHATLTLTFNKPLDTDSVPAKSAFTVKVAGSAVSLATTDPVAMSGAEVTLKLADAVTESQVVEVRYVQPAAGAKLQDKAGDAVETFSLGVENLTDTTSPILSRVYTTRDGEWVRVRFDEEVVFQATSSEMAAAFTVSVDGAPTTVTGAERFYTGRALGVTLTVSPAIASGQGIRVSYDKTALTDASDRLRDNAGNEAASFTGQRATNYSLVPPTAAPGTPSGGGGGGGGGTVGPGSAPVFGGATVAVPALRAGEAMTPVVLPEASGGDGALSYALSSTPAGLAGLSFDAGTRRLSGTPTASGDYAFVYRAHDADADRADSDAAVLRFSVRVEENPAAAAVRRVVRKALAAVGARTLAGVLGNVGARFADAAPDTNFRLAGREVLFGDAAPAVMERACRAAYERPVYERTVFERDTGCAAAQAVSGEDLMRASAFAWTPASAGESASSDAPLWALWGRGDFGAFEGRPEPGAYYDGETRTGWLGFDARRGPWVAGLALSRGTSEADYGFEVAGVSGRGRLETTLTAAYPYGRWRFANGLELRAVVGAGSGEARHLPGEGPRETGDLTMRMASVGVTRDLFRAAGFDFTVRADASAVRLEVERVAERPGAISGVSADTHRFRLGLEASRRVELAGGASLTPFVEAAARRDGGDSVEGSGVEIAGGVRYASALFHIEARGRWLAAHSGDGVRERGASVTARFGPGAQGRGLWFAVTPRWGAPAESAEALWRDDMPKLRPDAREAVLDARVGYGFAWDSRGLVTPFAETSAGESGSRVRLGTRFEASRVDLAMELAGERRESEGAEPVHGVRLDVRLGF